MSFFPPATGSGEKGLRKRKGPSPAGQGSTQSQTSEVTVESLHSVRTDFSPDALQKAVRFNADCSLLVTGGADGFLRLWEVGTGRAEAGYRCAVCPVGEAGPRWCQIGSSPFPERRLGLLGSPVPRAQL